MTDDTHYYLGFSYAPGIGPYYLSKLIEATGSIKHAWMASESLLKEQLGEKLSDDFIAFRSYFRSDSILKSLLKKCVQTTHKGDKNWPEKLSNIPDPPICLYIKGNIGLLTDNTPAIGIVGTRKPTPYGADVTENWTTTFATHHTTIISGMALGIDSIAHQAALAQQTKTIAVLGCGVDMAYPTSNQKLYDRILATTNSCIISEFPPGTPALPGHFISRNRIVSGLSDCVLVIEGSEKSGTLITASHAASQGKEVFCVPGPIHSPQSAAPHLLIKSGCHIALSPYDVLDRFQEYTHPAKESATQKSNSLLLDILKKGPTNAETLIKKTALTNQNLMIELSKLELDQLIKKLPNNEYIATRK